MAPGSRGTIVFNHANGFVAGTYRALFDSWRGAGWRVLAHERFGHDPKYPVTSGWPHLRDELLAFIDREAGAAPLVLVGHSMGGYLSLLAASRRPAQVRAVVLLDAPIVSGWRSHAFQVLKRTGLIRRAGPGKVSARRRTHWDDAAAVREHFVRKHAFARWHPRVLDDWLQAGFEPDPAGGLRLAFHRDIETRVYNTLPHHVPALLKRHPPGGPVAFVGGLRSAENRQLGVGFVRRLAGPRWRWLDGTHLFPMEQPDDTAAVVLQLLDEMV